MLRIFLSEYKRHFFFFLLSHLIFLIFSFSGKLPHTSLGLIFNMTDMPHVNKVATEHFLDILSKFRKSVVVYVDTLSNAFMFPFFNYQLLLLLLLLLSIIFLPVFIIQSNINFCMQINDFYKHIFLYFWLWVFGIMFAFYGILFFFFFFSG